MKTYLAKVSRQRDNGHGTESVLGMWVTKGGFSADVREAQIFTTEQGVKARLPRFWSFDIFEFDPGTMVTVSKD